MKHKITKKPDVFEGLSAAEIQANAEALFQSIGNGIITTDEFGHITRINPVALNILGLKESEALGKWFPRVITVLNPDQTVTGLINWPIMKVFLTGQAVSDKLLYRRKDGIVVPVRITISPIMLDGRPIGAVEVFQDITLEEEVDKMKSEFISLASHQLRTPLSAIKTYSHMLIGGYMGSVKPEQKQALRTIVAASNRMNELISTLLNVARIESGGIIVARKRVDVGSLCKTVVRQLNLAAETKGIALSLTTPSRPVIIKSDNMIVREIISNLLSNAIKYTPPKGNVSIILRNRSNNVLFTVTDTGLGIPKKSQEQIFSKFFRAENAVRQETTGTGLGLYVVKGLVTTLGGKIWFKSEENEGSTFYVTLPKIISHGNAQRNAKGSANDKSLSLEAPNSTAEQQSM